MTTVGGQIRNVDTVICQNIDALAGQRALLSQNILAQLRNLVEAVAVLLHTGSVNAEFSYAGVKPALAFIKSRAEFNFLGRFHKLLQASASHYTLDGDPSERLMLKYYEYLHRIRSLLRDRCRINVLANLEAFPVDLDPSLREYHEKIAARIEGTRSGQPPRNVTRGRFYIHKTRPFFVDGRIYYEVTFYPAVNRVNKFDRVIAFTDIDMTDEYAAVLTLQGDSIEVLGVRVPITIIRGWEVSIRPCELDNFASLLGINTKVRTNSPEYRYLMQVLTRGRCSLLDLIDLPDERYDALKSAATATVASPQIFPMLDHARRLVRSAKPGHNVLRYLLLRMRNQVLKLQYSPDACPQLSGLNLSYKCIPFDEMPFCTALREHNPRYWDLVASLDSTGRDHELLARRVRNNVDIYWMLYTPVVELEPFGDVTKLIADHNSRLYYKHAGRELVQDKGHVVIRGYEDGTVDIIKKLQEYAASGIDGYTAAVERWLEQDPGRVDDEAKKNALKVLFSHSRVALIYGAAGTGKSTMVNYIASYFDDKTKLFLAHTHPAVDNLRHKVSARHSTFRTISSHIARAVDTDCDLLVVDECSTVSNDDMLRVLQRTSFKMLVLVGDVYQVGSIWFGNWFSIVRSFVPDASVFELTTPFRTKNQDLVHFWNKVRNVDDDIAEVMARNGYSATLDKSLFEARGDDEIVLCLNYDGLYGINNVNRFLQSSNPNRAITWRAATYKVGDPVLFHETERFSPVIYNNLKGRIVDVVTGPGTITFDIELARSLTGVDVPRSLELVGDSTVRFTVYDYDTSDEDDDSLDTVVPFQVAYAVSIHKAQGLEYDSVKIVITDANEDDITHDIFYTAVTRARKSLKIYWTPETQQAVLRNLRRRKNEDDVPLLTARRGLTPVASSTPNAVRKGRSGTLGG